MCRNFLAAALITALALARPPTASGIGSIAAPYPEMPEIPPCSEALNSEPIPQLLERIKKRNDAFIFQVEGFDDPPCVIDALARRGDGALPALISLLKARDPTIESLTLNALGRMGDPARPAIPIVIRKSISCSTAHPSECDAAIAALGSLAQYDREQVVPHLTSLLDQPAHFEAAAKALERAGDAARAAEESLIQKLSAATAAHQGDRAATLISALVSVAPNSQATLRAVLDEGLRRGQFEHFNILASANPFPFELAPAVVTAIHELQDQPSRVPVLRTALVHTHSDLPCCQPVPEPTQDVSAQLADGLLSLTRQSRPIGLNDLIRELHLDPNHYDDQGDVIFRRLSRKPVGNPADLIDSINLSEVRQELDIVLKSGDCVSATAVRDRIPAPAEPKSRPPTVTVTTVQRKLAPGLIRFMTPQEKNRCGLMDLGGRCTGYVRIVKTFKDDDRCALIPNRGSWQVTD